MKALCSLLGIEVPIVLAPFGPWEEVELAAAVCDAGGLGSLGTALRSTGELRQQWSRLRDLTDRPFAVNHTGRPLNQEAFDATLEVGPTAISFHLGIPADLIARAHDRGIRWIQTVGDLDAAEIAAEAGADVIVAQGTEAGGNAGWISTLVLVPAVVDVVGPIPVVAAGGIADGRGMAAALALGAQGVSLGTRFLATTEMRIDQAWKNRIVMAHAREAVKVAQSDRVLPSFNVPQIGARFVPRVLRTALTDQLEQDPDGVDSQVVAARLRDEARAGRGHDLLPFTGQSAELVHDVIPAAEVVERLVAGCGSALRRAEALMTRSVS